MRGMHAARRGIVQHLFVSVCLWESKICLWHGLPIA